MFGYVRICKPELKIKEYEAYKAVYCSLCRFLGKEYGVWARLTLNYDFTFLAMLNMAFTPGCDSVRRGRCFFNPLKKCNYCESTEALKMPAAAAMLMSYYKLVDNINDEHGIKRLACFAVYPLFARARKKAARGFPELEKIVSEYISRQAELEADCCTELDKAADPSATALGQIFSLCGKEQSDKRVLDRLGYCIGRYIYLLDAACDLPQDIKNGSYNCLAHSAGDNPKKYAAERVIPQLYTCANEAAMAFELLEIKKYRTVLGNIIYLGIEDTFKKELNYEGPI